MNHVGSRDLMICGGGPDDMTDDLPSGTWTRTECGVQGPSRVLREYSSGCDLGSRRQEIRNLGMMQNCKDPAFGRYGRIDERWGVGHIEQDQAYQTVEYSPGVPIPELTELVAAAEDESYTWDTGDEESYQTNDGFG